MKHRLSVLPEESSASRERGMSVMVGGSGGGPGSGTLGSHRPSMSLGPGSHRPSMSMGAGSHRPSMSAAAGAHRPSMAGVNGSLLLACSGMSAEAVSLADQIGVTGDI